MIYGAMATLAMMYPARGGLVLGHIRGCYLKSEGLHLRGVCITYWAIATMNLTDIIDTTDLCLAFCSCSSWSDISLTESCCFLRRAEICDSLCTWASSKSRRSFCSSASRFLFNSIYSQINTTCAVDTSENVFQPTPFRFQL